MSTSFERVHELIGAIPKTSSHSKVIAPSIWSIHVNTIYEKKVRDGVMY